MSSPTDWRLRPLVRGVLDLSGCGLDAVPDEVRDVPGLRGLRLNGNHLRSLPAWLVELPKLEVLTLLANRFQPPCKGGMVLDHLRGTHALPLAERRLLFFLFLGDVDGALSHGGPMELARALCRPEPRIRLHAQLALARSRPSPLLADASYFFAGAPRTSRVAALRALGMTAARSLEAADTLFAGERPPRALVEAALARLLPVAVEADIEGPPDAAELSRLLLEANLDGLAARRRFHRAASTAALAFLSVYPAPLDESDETVLVPRLRTLSRCGHFDGEVLVDGLLRRRKRGVPLLLERGGAAALNTLRELVKDGCLDLSQKALRVLPPEIGELAELHTLDVSHNRLTLLPETLGDLGSLRNLTASYNALVRLPESLSRLAQLDTLRLECARTVNDFEPVFRLPRLRSLSLGSCELARVPSGIGDLSSLEQVWLNNNGLSDLPPELARLRSLTFLHLSGNPLVEVPAVVFEMTQLKTLWLEGTVLERLSPQIGRLVNLERLCIWYNRLTELPVELYGMTNLRELRVSNNRLPERAVKELREALPQCTIY